jgi:hypothetical protein
LAKADAEMANKMLVMVSLNQYLTPSLCWLEISFINNSLY